MKKHTITDMQTTAVGQDKLRFVAEGKMHLNPLLEKYKGDALVFQSFIRYYHTVTIYP